MQSRGNNKKIQMVNGFIIIAAVALSNLAQRKKSN